MAVRKRVSNIKQLKLLANTIRQDIIRSLVEAGSGHSAGSLGMADVFTALFFNVMKLAPKRPRWKDRDYFLLSNGHICPVLYATMAHVGFFPVKELTTLRKLGSRLQGHPHRTALPGLESTSGPLGSGLSQAAGIAKGLKIDGLTNRVYCMMGDGELNEGQVWEAALTCNKHKLNNITAIIDRNNIQIDGYTEAVMPLEPLREKWESFGFHVLEIDGNNIREIIDACKKAKAIYEKPTCILAHNTPGKGVSFMENKPQWHGKAPTPEEAQRALLELEGWRQDIERGLDA